MATVRGAQSGRKAARNAFWTCCRSVVLLLPCALTLGAEDVAGTSMKPGTLAAFDTYIKGAEQRINRLVKSPEFLWAAQSPDLMARIRKGEVLVSAVQGKGSIDVPDGMIHDWLGAAFIPGTTLAKTLAFDQNYDKHKDFFGPEVIDSKLVRRSGNDFEIYLKVLKKKVITVVLNTTHEVHYYPVSKTREHSRSYSTRITEVKDPGKPEERELPPGKDHGFMWKLYTYWRFEERDGGVYIECEAISVSRDIPTGLGWLISPIVRNLPKESLNNTMVATKRALQQ